MIFRGKAVAGLALYLLATVPPFLACVWYVATPGHFPAPFVPRMVYPGVADICSGAMFYCAALFVALRRGPWYGPRIFGLLAALYTAAGYVANGYHPFYVAVEAAVLMGVTLFAAAWSVMLGNGSFHAQPRLGRAAVLAVVFYGVCGLGVLWEMGLESLTPPTYYFGIQYVVDLTGRVLKQEYSHDGGTRFYDLAGNQITDRKFTRNSYSSTLAFSNVFIGRALPPFYYHDMVQYRSPQTYLLPAYDVPPGENWFYVAPARTIVGYKAQTRQRIGTISREGFYPGYQPAPPLPGRLVAAYQLQHFVSIKNTAYFLDFDQRRMVPVFSDPGTKLESVSPMHSYQRETDVSDLTVLALPTEARIVDTMGRTLAHLPYDRDVARYGVLGVAMMPTRDRFFLHYQPGYWINFRERSKMPSFMEETDARGTVLASYTLPPEPPQEIRRTWLQFVLGTLATPVFTYGDIAYSEIGATLGSRHLAERLKELRSEGRKHTVKRLALITLVSLGFAGLTLFWARRRWFSWRRAWAWAAFVFGFNLAGLIVFRLCADWPVRVKCPACGRLRPVDQETCPACHAPWPQPPREGTEIFTPVESTATGAGAVPV